MWDISLSLNIARLGADVMSLGREYQKYAVVREREGGGGVEGGNGERERGESERERKLVTEKYS